MPSSDKLYETCLPILEDDAIDEDDKPDKLEELIKSEFQLTGKALEDAVLSLLWRYRGRDGTSKVLAPIRTGVARRPSPAPWQLQRSITPISMSTRSLSQSSQRPTNLNLASPGYTRPLSYSSAASSSPKPSPRLAYASPIPHSPSLTAYRPIDSSTNLEAFDEYESDVDFLVNDDDASSNASFGEYYQGPNEYTVPYTVDMSPYDMLRSVLRDHRTDQELEKILQDNGYDLSATIADLIEQQEPESQSQPSEKRAVTIGMSMSPTPRTRTLTPASQAKTPVVCRYWMATGSCARADCRFGHDLTNHICKYWLAGDCLAGDSCIFSHDPTALVSRMTMDDATVVRPETNELPPTDDESFPALHRTISNPFEEATAISSPKPVTFNPTANFVPGALSRTNSSQGSTSLTPGPAITDDDFPTLGSTSKAAKTRRGTRGHGHTQPRDTYAPSSLADIVRMSPSPQPGLNPQKNSSGTKSTTARGIPAPEHIPWLETGDSANRAYLKARAEAFRHGGLRNKFLQSAAQAWNRNDARGAKVLSLRGQNENALMREAHREAARLLYEERNSAGPQTEVYVDLHGMHSLPPARDVADRNRTPP